MSRIARPAIVRSIDVIDSEIDAINDEFRRLYPCLQLDTATSGDWQTAINQEPELVARRAALFVERAYAKSDADDAEYEAEKKAKRAERAAQRKAAKARPRPGSAIKLSIPTLFQANPGDFTTVGLFSNVQNFGSGWRLTHDHGDFLLIEGELADGRTISANVSRDALQAA